MTKNAIGCWSKGKTKRPYSFAFTMYNGYNYSSSSNKTAAFFAMPELLKVHILHLEFGFSWIILSVFCSLPLHMKSWLWKSITVEVSNDCVTALLLLQSQRCGQL